MADRDGARTRPQTQRVSDLWPILGDAMRLLEQLDLPADLRTLDTRGFADLAGEIRQEIITTIARTGGHLGASLGVVELTLALHAELESPKDMIVWDVGHQAYAHKLVTGRLDAFPTIRTHGGLSGFPKRSESEHDAFGTGHSSTSVSVGVGLAEAVRLAGEPDGGRVVAVIGDGALTGGMAYEGLNQAGHLRTPLVVVLNDNDMSIKKNVGAISAYLSRLRTEPTLYRLRRDFERRVQRLPVMGERMYAVGAQLKDGVKAALVPGMLFEELGFTYIGVIDGHDIDVPAHQPPARAGHQRARAAARAHRQGSGATRPPRSSRTASTASRPSRSRPGGRVSAEGRSATPRRSAGPWCAWRPTTTAHRGHHGGHGRGHGARSARGGVPGSLLRRGHRRGARGGLRRRAGGGRHATGRGRSTRPSCSGPTTS